MKKGSIFITVGLLMITAALCITGYNIYDNYRAGEAADNILNELVLQIDDDPVPPDGRKLRGNSEEYEEFPDYLLNPKMDMPTQIIDGKEYVGMLSIPSLDKEFPVLNEWSYSNLRKAPCRYVGTAYLNNMVICAHNYNKHFGSIKNLSYGDKVIFTDMDGNVFNYEVVEIETLLPSAVEEMTTGEWDLTLFTCTLSGRSRVTVRCVKTEV